MLLTNAFVSLAALASFAAALPGGDWSGHRSSEKETPSYTQYSEEEPIAEIVTKTSVYEKPTTYTTTKTVAIPVTTVAEYPETFATAVEYTSTGYSTKVRITAVQFVHQLTACQTYTDYETKVETKTYSTVSVITTTIYTTKVQSDVKTKTELKTVPYTSVDTKYSTTVKNYEKTHVTSTASTAVYTETSKVPITSLYFETKTACETKPCTTKEGYGDGY
ncbi:hypothetical protein SNOG_00203 [Parastagonospora nodorum SN15]|uniref:Uncharacterized protein n=1 Tax=Phaeosphaeria nodorum (strain SN15 / ATCC MYA-4574 / FGSC 10173) TaxID=321614 RepID=Q0V711_PHANO|nr:hypothetical protein SNOG_00203 [Parastagonospora nodorum SN15]EAT91698.2 hypothetical protein SNOG_00203 [Parastagonospora nodorum SN15]